MGELHACHVVAVTAVKDDRVYFRNPWCPCEHRNGTELSDPTRRVEDNKTGLESMRKASFLGLMDGALLSAQRLNSMRWDTPSDMSLL